MEINTDPISQATLYDMHLGKSLENLRNTSINMRQESSSKQQNALVEVNMGWCEQWQVEAKLHNGPLYFQTITHIGLKG